MKTVKVNRWLVLALAVLALGGLLAACGSSSDSSGSSESSGGETSGSTTASTEETTTAQYEDELPQGPNPVGKAAGATLGFVSACQNCEAMSRLSAAFEDAAGAAGMNVRIYDTKGNPADTAKGVETLLQAGADVIALGALPPQVVGTAAKAAKEKGVPIFGVDTGVPTSAAEGITAFNIEENVPEAQTALAEKMVETIGPNGKILYLYDKVLPVGMLYDQGLRAGLGNTEILAEEQIDLTKITPQGQDVTATWLVKYPEVDAVLCAYDASCLGAYQAVRAAGKEIPVYGNNGNLENLDLIRQGADYTTNALALELQAWLGTDRSISLLNGEKVDDPPLVRDLLITGENVPETGVYDGSELYGDFEKAFVERWGVE